MGRRRQQSRRRSYKNYKAPTNSHSEDAMVCHGFRNSNILVEEEYEEDSSVSTSDSPKPVNNNRRRTPRKSRKKYSRKGNQNVTDNKDNTMCGALAPEAVRSEYVAMDCEMVGTGQDGKTSALARVSLVDWYGRILLDTYVKVHTAVTDLRTFVSGVTLDKIVPDSPYAMEYSECVSLVQGLIYGKVLVGHSLKNDLKILQISHPWYDIRDTAKYEPFMRVEGYNLLPRKLKDLAGEKLGLSIQTSGRGHDSIEDAWTAMQLYKLVGPHWDQTMGYKVQKTMKIVGPQNVQDECMQPKLHNGYTLVVGCR